MDVRGIDLLALVPIVIIAATAALVLVLDLLRRSHAVVLAAVAIFGLLIAALAALGLRFYLHRRALFFESLDVDRFGIGFIVLFVMAAILAIYFSPATAKRRSLSPGPYYALIAVGTAGMTVLAQAADLATLFVGLEVMSMSFYVLAALDRSDTRSAEAGLKYFLVGSFASGVVLYGIALVYGATGTLDLRKIPYATTDAVLARAGLALLLAGFLFKVGAAPFHMWAPDVYEGAPTPVSLLLSTGVKAAGFAALLRVLMLGFPNLAADWAPLVAAAAVISMAWGNLAAMGQANLKRLLAYSSVGHAGYVLIGVAVAADPDANGVTSVIVYLLAYILTSAGAFGCLALLSTGTPVATDPIEASFGPASGELITEFKGLAWRRPAMAMSLTICLLSLAGIPGTAGFVGKLSVFLAALTAGQWPLALVGIATSVLAAYYYLRVIVAMFMEEPVDVELGTADFSGRIALVLAISGILVVGLHPGLALRLAAHAAAALF